MHTIGIVATSSQHRATDLLMGIALVAAPAIVVGILVTVGQSTVEHARGLPRFIREYRRQAIGILVAGIVLAVILTALGVPVPVALLIGVGCAIVFMLFVAA